MNPILFETKVRSTASLRPYLAKDMSVDQRSLVSSAGRRRSRKFLWLCIAVFVVLGVVFASGSLNAVSPDQVDEKTLAESH